MPRSYRNPPVIEAVCEFRFLETQRWDWTIPGLVYEKISNSFPKKRQQTVIELSMPYLRPIEGSPPGDVARMQFLNDEETRLVQVWPNTLAINRLKPYGSWNTYKEEILSQLKVYQQVSGQDGLTRIGLRYINRIELPASEPQGADLGAYLVSIPKVSTSIPQAYRSFLMQLDIPYEDDPPTNLRLILGTVPPQVADSVAVMLDLDMVTEPEHVPSLDSVSDWLEKAHGRLEEAFDSSLTDRTHKDLLQEIA
jgi:uncharacterized protein (TIGR04255 family)